MVLLAYMMLLAEAVDPISGGAGWVGAGLLGAVLGWLMFVHLPSKDKQSKELIADNYGHVERLAAKYASDMTQTRSDFKDMLESVVTHCEREMQSVTLRFTSQIELLNRMVKQQPPASTP